MKASYEDYRPQFQITLQPNNPRIADYCKQLILNFNDIGIANLFDFKKRVEQKTALFGLIHVLDEFDEIHFEVQSFLTHEVFRILHQNETFVSITCRKKEFEFAFKDLDQSRFN